MPTGPAHQKVNEADDTAEDCRCMIGTDHLVGDDSPLGEELSPWDAEDIWLSSGMDEDYDMR